MARKAIILKDMNGNELYPATYRDNSNRVLEDQYLVKYQTSSSTVDPKYKPYLMQAEPVEDPQTHLNTIRVTRGDGTTITIGGGAISTTFAQVGGQARENTSLNTELTTIDNQFTTQGGRITTVEGSVSTLSDEVTTLSGNVTNLGNRVTTAEGNITTLSSNVTTLGTRVTTAEGSITALDSRVTTAEGNITTLDTNVTNLGTRVTTAEGNITSLGSRVTTAETNITNLNAAIKGVEDQYALSDSQSTPPGPTATWTTTVPEATGTQVIWKRTKVSISGESPYYTTAICLRNISMIPGPKGDKGDTGDKGADVVDSYKVFEVSNSSAVPPETPPEDWTQTIPPVNAGQYIWYRQVTWYENAAGPQYGPPYLDNANNNFAVVLSGKVAFTNLSTPGGTVIDGANISTGEVSAAHIKLGGNLDIYETLNSSIVGGNIGYTPFDGETGIAIQKNNNGFIASSDGLRLKGNRMIFSGAGIWGESLPTWSSSLHPAGTIFFVVEK